ncbi:DNA-directed RNA polymerase III subunit RPC7-like isoform X1 [Cucumis melo var. makuwa]|uniref:DNA-directed RNA polymerase III subunit RPC7-like isoform X1 n=1 Tax=Cucumis melo var. makuwa TaxID=1194695 RepID=A0A5D3BVU1_CUCMM|nr:DNA-directed RNA polymerase III subunit RPC7-like isoform X1 [Cucumis melo var. makuwa]
MAFRGRGRGRGGGGGSFQYAKQEPFELFPENVTLPSVSEMPEELALAMGQINFLKYWKASPFYLEENVMKKMQRTEIEKFSDRLKMNSTLKRDSLAQIIQLTSRNFPEELVEGFKGKLRTKRKVQWNPESGLKKMDFLEKREESLKGQDKEDKEKKEGEEGEDEDEEEEDAQSEELTDDDYYQNEYFDDDEDDYNMEEEGGGFLPINAKADVIWSNIVADEPEY